MLSSTSNSKTPGKTHIVLVLALCAMFCGSVEFVTEHFFGRVSRIEKRRETEYRAAVAVRSAQTRRKISTLVVGNSLLLHGIDFPQLQEYVGPELELHRAVFENTYFLDWYYGLQKMFRAGAQPDLTVLVLSPAQLTSDGIDGDYTVHMLVDSRDLISFAKDTHADRNGFSVFALDNLSFFFGSRAEVRTWILGKLLPDLPNLTRYFRSHYKLSAADESDVLDLADRRLNQLRSLCERYGTGFILVIPPAVGDSGVGAVTQAGVAQGVPVLMPFRPGILPVEDYSDEVHLNSTGAGKFTLALAADLRKVTRHNTHTETASGVSGSSLFQHFQKSANHVVPAEFATGAVAASK